MAYLIGMDLGTTNIKAILMSKDGTLVASASRTNELLLQGTDYVEQDAETWWRNAEEIFRELRQQAGQEIIADVRAIAISSQSVTLLPVDIDGVPLRNAIVWMDQRAKQELRDVVDIVGESRYIEITGAQPGVAFLPGKLRWMKLHEPEILEKTDCLLQANAYLNYKLTGVRAADMDQAIRSQCLDIKTGRWSAEIGAAIGVDLERLLPPPQAVDSIIGCVTEGAAAATGLVPGIPVTAGACDALASVYATGLCSLGEASESSGTTSLVFVGAERLGPASLPVASRPFPLKEVPYLFDGPINTSGAALKWYLDTFGAEEKQEAEARGISIYEELNREAAEAAPGSGGVIFFPYLMGERAPLWNSYAKGMFIGMSMNTQHRDMARAVLEGTAFALRHVIEVIRSTGTEVNSLRITGGGARSRTWAKIKASMLGTPVMLMDEGAGDVPVGDVLIAGQAVGLFDNLQETMQKILRVKEVIYPEPDWTAVYDRMYPFYRSLYEALAPELEKMEQEMF